MIGSRADIVDRLKPAAAAVVIRLRSLGDTVLTTPALALLKQSRPDLRVYVVLEPRWAPLLEANPDVEGVIPMTGLWSTAAMLRRLRPELCLNLHGGPSSAWLTALSGARWRAGFAHFAFQAAYNVRIPRAQQILGRAENEPVHTAEHLASAILYLTADRRPIPGARLFAAAGKPRSPYAVLHLGASSFTKQWPPDRFVELAGWLERSQGLTPVILTGGQSGWPEEAARFQVQDSLPLPDLLSLIQGAELFVGNDSGPAHVAAAFGVPSVVIFGSSNSLLWRPWNSPHQLVETRWDCKPCPGDRCYAFDRPHCILSVQLEGVQQAVLAALASRPALPA